MPVHAATAPIGRPTCSILGCCSFCQVITDRSQIIKISMLFLRCSTAIDDVFFRRSLVLPNWLPNDFRKLLLHPPVTKLLRAHGELRVLNKSLRYTGPDGGQTDRQRRETFLGRCLPYFPRYCTTYATPQIMAQLRMTRFAWHNGLYYFVPSFPAQYGCMGM